MYLLDDRFWTRRRDEPPPVRDWYAEAGFSNFLVFENDRNSVFGSLDMHELVGLAEL